MRDSRRQVRTGALIGLAILLGLSAGVASSQLRHLSFRTVSVENTRRASDFEAPPVSTVKRGVQGLEPLQAEVAALGLTGPTIDRARQITHWVRNQQSDDPDQWLDGNDDSSDDAVELLQRMRRGVPGACRRMSYVLLGALQAAGIDARVVILGTSVEDSDYHSTLELWLPEENRWILADSSYDSLFTHNGRPVSAWEAVSIWRSGGRVDFDRGTDRKPVPDHSFFRRFSHVYVAKQSPAVDGTSVRGWNLRRTGFLHYYDAEVEPYPETRKRVAVAVLLASVGAILLIGLIVIWRFSSRLIVAGGGAAAVSTDKTTGGQAIVDHACR